jgi:hypothetical protein
LDKAEKKIKQLEKLKLLEKKGKIKVKDTRTINPFYIELIDESVEDKLKKILS